MSIDNAKLAALAAANREKGEDQTQANAGGNFVRETPEEGYCNLRLVSYIELGQHPEEFEGQKKTPKKVYLAFELSGAKWPATNEETGRTKPFVIGFTMTLSNSDRSNYHKLFTTMAHGTQAKHMMELLGHAFVGQVFHNKSKDGKKTYANLNSKKTGYTIKPAFDDIPDRASGGVVRVPVEVDPAQTGIRVFLWDFADKEQWDSIFIDGEQAARVDEETGKELSPARSNNWLQNMIKSALNFRGSPIYCLLEGEGELDLGDAETPERGQSDADKIAAGMAGGKAVKESYDLNDDIPF